MKNFFEPKIVIYHVGTVEAVLMPFERIQTLLADSHYHYALQKHITGISSCLYELWLP